MSLFPATVEARRRVMASPVFTAAAWDFHAKGTVRWSSTDVRGVRVTVHAARSVAVAA